jgi:hypothetical protein
MKILGLAQFGTTFCARFELRMFEAGIVPMPTTGLQCRNVLLGQPDALLKIILEGSVKSSKIIDLRGYFARRKHFAKTCQRLRRT